MEEWRELKDYKNYEISTLGRIRSKTRKVVDKNGKDKIIPEKELMIFIRNKSRFFKIQTADNKKRKQISLLEAMAETFVEGYDKDNDIPYTYNLDSTTITMKDLKVIKNSNIAILYENIADNWKEIKKGYFISEEGRLFSMTKYIKKKNGVAEIKIGKEIKAEKNCKNGYYQFRTIGKTVHRLVAEMFIPNPNNLPCVNHIDGDKSNNCVDNLEWCDYSHNNKHAYDIVGRRKVRVGSRKRSCSSINKKTNEKQIYNSIAEASRKTKISESQIRRLLDGESSNDKYVFEYI